MATTTNSLDGLLYIRNGNITARWNFPDSIGSSIASPAGTGNAASVTYSFLSTVPSYSSVTGFLAFDAAQQQATRDILAAIQEVANIDFIEAGGVAQITFGMSSQPLGQGGSAYTPSYGYSYSGSTITSVSEQAVAGDVWLNRNAGWDANAWQAGQDGYVTLLHEIGHALGLKHPFESGANGFTLAGFLDNESHTVMSYTMAPHSRLIEVSGTSMSYSWRETFIRPSTLMPLDIEALQYLYGADTSTRTGNDVYQWGQNAELLETIWDGGGIDTIDCANQIFTCVIDLRAGFYSSIALRQTDAEIRSGLELPSWFTQALPSDIYNGSNNLAIATGVVIENAIGGAGNDQITGNAANNMLAGGGGTDSLSGNSGHDTLNGGAGADTMSGGTGSDTYVVDNAGDIVTELAAQGVDLVQSSVTYTLTANVEKLALTGSAAIDATGNELNNVLTGNSAANTLSGLAGADTLNGGAGADTMSGGTGNDTYVVDNAGDIVTELAAQGVDLVQSSITYTLTANVEKLTLTGTTVINGIGNGMSNSLLGNAAANRLTGLSGADTMNGGAGNDTLVGGGGKDVLTGGLGNDSFVFNTALNAAANIDTLTDFTSGADKIRLDDDIFATLAGQTVLTADQFWVADGATAAQDAFDRILYDTATGALAYDADGVGGAAAIQFAMLNTQPALLVSDFLVIV